MSEPQPLPPWYRPKGVKTKHDFPKAKPGRPDRYEFTIGDLKAGKPRRLDKHLHERFQGYSRSFLQKMIKDGRILVDGQTVRSSWHISTGQKITILLPPGSAYQAEEMPFAVLYEDEHLIAVNKPPGVIVHPARGRKTGTMFHGLMHYYRERIAADPSFRIRTVHRLDENTSGVIVFPLDQPSNRELTNQFEFRRLAKTYLLLVHGRVAFEEKLVDAPIGFHRTIKQRGAVDGLGAREAQTRFVRIGASPCGGYSLLRAHPHTGRSHQLRIHAELIGHPIVGDVLYQGRKDDPAFGEARPRVCLHAETLSLTHPIRGHPMTLRAPLYADIADLARKVGVPLGETSAAPTSD